MATPASSRDVPRISPEEVKKRVEQGERIYFLDVRRHPDDFQIQGAVYHEPEALLAAPRAEMPVPSDQLIVTYCT